MGQRPVKTREHTKTHIQHPFYEACRLSSFGQFTCRQCRYGFAPYPNELPAFRLPATAKSKDKILFLVEGKQGGIFEARNIPADQMDPLLGIGCPNIVYPYLRGNIADIITRAGFPPVHLAEINFEVFYQQRRQALAEAAAAAPAAGAAN